MTLESVLAGEALAAEGAREGLDGQVDSLVALQVVVAAEGLGALITLEGLLRGRNAVVVVGHAVAAVALQSHAANHRLMGHDRAAHGYVVVGVRAVLARQTARGRGRRGLRRRLLAVVAVAMLGSRGSIVARVAGRSGEGVGVDMRSSARRSLRLCGVGSDATVRRGDRCHWVAVVAAVLSVEGSSHALGTGRRLGAALVGVAHVVLAVNRRARSVRRLGHLLLGLGMVRRGVGVPAAMRRGGTVCVLHVAVGSLGAGAVDAGETVGAETVTGSYKDILVSFIVKHAGGVGATYWEYPEEEEERTEGERQLQDVVTRSW